METPWLFGHQITIALCRYGSGSYRDIKKLLDIPRLRNLGSTESFQGFDEGHLKQVIHFYLLLYWAKLGSTKA